MGSTRIVAIGNSLLASSLPGPAKFDSLLPEEDYWLHIVFLGKDWREVTPILPKLSLLRPEIVLLQDQLLFHVSDERRIPFSVRVRMSLSFAVRTLLGLGFKAEAKNHFSSLGPGKVDERNQHLEKLYHENIPIKPAALDFLHKLNEISSKVIVFHLPRSVSLQASDAQQRWRVELEKNLEPMGIKVISIGKPLPDDHYYDHSHSNEKGQQVRIEQFQELIKELQR